MTTLPPSPFTDSALGVASFGAEQAVATDGPRVAAAVPIEHFQGWDLHPRASLPATAGRKAGAESSMSTGGHQEARTATRLEPPVVSGLLDGTDCIGEIFHYARLLIAEDNAVHRRFVLDEAAFMAELDEPPLFLRRA